MRVLKKEHSARGRAQDEAGAPPPYPSCAGLCPCVVGEGGGAQDRDWSGAECFRLLGSSTSSTELNLKFSVFFLFSHTLTAESAPLALSFLGHSAACVGPISDTHPPTQGNWYWAVAVAHKRTRATAQPAASRPLGPCVLKKSTPHAGARRRRPGCVFTTRVLVYSYY